MTTIRHAVAERLVDAYARAYEAALTEPCKDTVAPAIASRAALLAHFDQVGADVQHENRLRRAAESECLDAHVALRAAEAERDNARRQRDIVEGHNLVIRAKAEVYDIAVIERDALRASNASLKRRIENALKIDAWVGVGARGAGLAGADAASEVAMMYRDAIHDALDATESRKESLRINTQEPTQGK